MADPEVVEGIVDEALPNTLFRVKLDSGEDQLAFKIGRAAQKRNHEGKNGGDGGVYKHSPVVSRLKGVLA